MLRWVVPIRLATSALPRPMTSNRAAARWRGVKLEDIGFVSAFRAALDVAGRCWTGLDISGRGGTGTSRPAWTGLDMAGLGSGSCRISDGLASLMISLASPQDPPNCII